MGFARNKVPAEQNAEVLDIEEGLVSSTQVPLGRRSMAFIRVLKK